MAVAVVPFREPIFPSVSPGLTVYVVPPVFEFALVLLPLEFA